MNEELTNDLRREFDVEPGSFLAATMEGHWDRERLARLVRLMHQACMDAEGLRTCDKWVAAGFHELDVNFDRYLPAACRVDEELIADVKEHFTLLASWFFCNQAPMDTSALDSEMGALLKRGPALRFHTT